ncbi:anti-sigma factor [Rhizobacter sp. OV335]|jgi:anti-sigma factor RsiW|uniref:anti-sigma factor family protein n=1 Tax=Rhizobacter sp. OV335 TaxID=1500264 RepID=UPI00090F3910|nr:anti-sigma factor [Rhizobacter sp. OV335]SHM26021.1 Transmembrane transcriptional regulator (anti-sigma factor RsiW) [Rhizobacter sp. OV335]
MSRFDATPQALNAFIDGELDLATQLEAEALVERDAALRQHTEQLRELSRAVRLQADYHAAPAALRAHLGRRPHQPRWLPSFTWRIAGAGALCSLVLAWGLQMALAPSASDLLLNEAVASHVRATLAQRSIDVASTDQHTVKPWLSARLDFSPPVQHPVAAGAVLQGGRIDYLGGRPVAVLVYQLRAHQIDVFIWPSRERPAIDTPAARRGFQTAAAGFDGMAWLAVSDVNAEDLARVLQALTAGDGAPR